MMRRLGMRHWNDDSLRDASIWKDDKFKQVEASDIEQETSKALRPLDDLGVLVLFSVFESAVREHLEGIIKPLTTDLGHPILNDAAGDVLEGIRYGSFAIKVLKPLQDQGRITAELSDKVKQVRDFRNWVAHGKREPGPQHIKSLTVNATFTRLKDFLDTLGIAVEAELNQSAESSQRGIDEAPE